MDCLVCKSAMKFYFKKAFDDYGLKEVDYFRCGECGFCASKTHYEMSYKEWSDLNFSYYSANHRRTDNPYNQNQRYFNQALMLNIIYRHGLIAGNRWLDWGSGNGNVASLLNKYFQISMDTYDKYFTSEFNNVEASSLEAKSFNFVMTTAVIEHLRTRSELDEIEAYVAQTGCFSIHTLVAQSIPKDPYWMYLLPVHCSFFTNRSMDILMEQWGYRCSVYNEKAKLWSLFRNEPSFIQSKSEGVNNSLGWEYLHYKIGFMDYWK